MNTKSPNLNTYNEHYSYFQKLLRKNNIEGIISGSEGKMQLPYVEQYEALLKVTPGIILLVNFSQHSYLYHSDNISQLDLDIDLMYEYGATYTFSLFQKDHYEIMRNDIFPEVYKLFGEYIENGEIDRLRVTYCNKMRTPSGEYRWFMHHLSVLTSNQNEPLIGLKYMIEIDLFKKDNALDFAAYLINEDGTNTVVLERTYNPSEILLSKREKEVIALLIKGKTSKQIAHELNISQHTVNTHRKNMLQKTNTSNITELVSATTFK